PLSVRVDYALKVEARDFQAEYEGKPDGTPPKVHVRLSAKLVRMPQRTMVAGETFESVITADSNTFDSIVRAFDAATREVNGQIIRWTLATGTPARKREK
ncbi:MAG: ABC-type transport auxiliary lipoprotein family protein, partial [Pseudomonadota bacterium]|nr:ABC-type transport auxiliary lipoprotein family protein [Pseudomonadota bacterium]